MLLYGSADTEAALAGLRDLATLEWYAVPLMAIVFYIWGLEIKKARTTGKWTVVICGLTVFGMDFFNETWNGWICWFTQNQAFWTTPGDTALRVMVGWNIEIIFMFMINGLFWGNLLDDDPKKKILGMNNRWFWAIGLAAFAVFIEVCLNIGGHLTWVYPWWEATPLGVILIFLIGYFHFYVACILVLKLKTVKKQLIAVGCIYLVAIVMNVIASLAGMVY